ncbi:MAG: pantetheine-phosphate adenylyltransferase [Candidatus Brocadiia bacterium]
METAVYISPCGPVELTVRRGKLTRVRLLRQGRPAASGERRSPAMGRFLRALEAYFAGRPVRVSAAELDLSAATEFQCLVYVALMEVPPGRVINYSELALLAGRPGASRAVGQAMGRNPVPIFVPCHRVIRADGRPGGFGAGAEWKHCLLAQEGWTVEEGRLVKKEDKKADTCVYAGSFDPPTEGHMYMIEQGAALFGRLIVSVGVNPNKRYTFSVAERLEMLRECTRDFANVEVDSFEAKLLVRYAESMGARYILRGIRSEEDYRFEHTMRNVNEDLAPEISTVFLIPPREICELSSSFVKGLVGFEGWKEVVKPYVPEPVYERLLVGDIQWQERRAGPEGGTD